MKRKVEPKTVALFERPFKKRDFQQLRKKVADLRKVCEAMQLEWFDADLPKAERFNRWYWYAPKFLDKMHRSKKLVAFASELFGEPVIPTYSYLSMYGGEGICPKHRDRPQCRYTIDLCIDQKEPWSIFIESVEDGKGYRSYRLNPGEALCYSGTHQTHYRNRIKKKNHCDLAFFHFVGKDFKGKLSIKPSEEPSQGL